MTPEQMKKWDCVYSVAADQLCKAGGFEWIRKVTPQCSSKGLAIREDITMEALKEHLVDQLKIAGCKKLWLVSIYKIDSEDPPYLWILCRGEFENENRTSGTAEHA